MGRYEVLLAVAIVAGAPGLGLARAPAVCIAGHQPTCPPDGLDAEALGLALRIEMRKAGMDGEVFETGAAGDCAGDCTVAIVLDGRGASLVAGGATVPLDLVLLRAGLGAGVEWTRLEASPPARLSGRVRSVIVPAIEAEVEAVLLAGRWLRVSAAVFARAFPAWQAWDWDGRTVYETPRWSAGAALRVGAVFP